MSSLGSTSQMPASMTSDTVDIKTKAVRSIKWSYLATLLPQLVRPLVTISLARLLLPEDYGIVGMAAAIVQLADLFRTLGLGDAVIQCERTVFEDALNVGFWANCATAALFVLSLQIAAPHIAAFFQEPRMTAVIRVQSIGMLFSALSCMQHARLRRDFGYKTLAWLAVVPTVVPLLVAIPLAAMGFTYWALVISSLVGSALGTILLWLQSDWLPRFSFNTQIARSLVVFGGYTILEDLLLWVTMMGDNVIAGRMLGMTDAGVYVFSYNIMAIAIGTILFPLSSLAYTTFCEVRNNPDRLRHLFAEGTRLVSTIVIPASIGLASVTPLLVVCLFGNRWRPMIPVLQVLAVMPGLAYSTQLFSYAFKSVGRADIMPKLNFLTVVYAILVLTIGARYGLIAFSVARATVGIVFVLPQIILASKILGMPLGFFWRAIRYPAAASTILLLVYPIAAWGADANLSVLSGIGLLGGLTAIGASAYFIALWLLDSQAVRQALRLVVASTR